MRSSGPRMASTMQNSEAPEARVSSAAASTSSASRNGVAFTGLSKRDDCEQKWQSSGQPPVRAERMPSISTVGPHQARRTWWAKAASDVTHPSGREARPATSAAVSWRRSSRRACSAARSRLRALWSSTSGCSGCTGFEAGSARSPLLRLGACRLTVVRMGGAASPGIAETVVGEAGRPGRATGARAVAWDFSTEPEFEEQLAWMRGFVREEVFPLETLGARS